MPSDTKHVSRSRIGKKQIVCFLPPDINETAYDFALETGISRQALLAMALNFFMRQNDHSSRLSTRTKRLFRIPGRKRCLRKNAYGRTGKSALAGWYDERDISIMSTALSKMDKNFQIAAENGLRGLLKLSDAEILMENQRLDGDEASTVTEVELLDKRDNETLHVGNWEDKLTENVESFPNF